MMTKKQLKERVDDLERELNKEGGKFFQGCYIKPGLKKRVNNLERIVDALLDYLEVETETESTRVVKKDKLKGVKSSGRK